MHRFKVYQVIVHIAGWLLFMAFPILFINGDQSGAALPVLRDPYYWLFLPHLFFSLLLEYLPAHTGLFFQKIVYLVCRYCPDSVYWRFLIATVR